MHINDMTDEQLGAWFRRALVDLCSGCIDHKTDPLVKDIYKHSHERMIKAQNHNHQMYSNRIARTNDQETKISTNEERCRNLETDYTDVTTIAPADASDAGKSNELVKSEKKAYGQNKNVMLTDEEGAHLRELYGEDLKMAIDILDAYIENGGKKAKKYKDHAAVMRRGNWVWNKVQETKLAEKRLENANRPTNVKSFKQADRDERTRFFMDTSVVDRMIENESKAI
jgi:hypothetical protein